MLKKKKSVFRVKKKSLKRSRIFNKWLETKISYLILYYYTANCPGTSWARQNVKEVPLFTQSTKKKKSSDSYCKIQNL